jgi:hypothetical protein
VSHSKQSFFSSISEASIGGTYITFINTVSNFGGTWPDTLVPIAIELFTWSSCVVPSDSPYFNEKGAVQMMEEEGFNFILFIF